VQRIDPHHQDRVGVIEVCHPGAVVGPGQLAEERGIDRVGGAVDVGGARAANDSLDQPGLFVGGPAADEGGGALTRVSESIGDARRGLVPGDRAEAAVAGADHRPSDSLR
jgi:hypothetical protein